MARRFGLLGIRLAGSALLLWLAFRAVPIGNLAAHISSLNWVHYPAIALLTVACLLLLALRLQGLARHGGATQRFSLFLKVTWIGQFLNGYLPGAVGGDIFKAVALGDERPDGKAKAAGTVLIDRVAALAALLVLAAAGLVLGPDINWKTSFDSLPAFSSGSLALLVGAGILAILSVVVLSRTRLWQRLLNALRAAYESAKASAKSPALIAKTVLLAGLVHLFNFSIFYFAARMAGIEIPFGAVLMVMPLVLLVSMLPVSINGHGFREVLLVAFFKWGSFAAPGLSPSESALMASLLYVTNDLVWNLPGGVLLLLLRKGAKHPPTRD